MKKIFTIAGVMLALSVSLASAAGINLSWNDCGTFGTSAQSFDCASNSGSPFTMVASFVPPPAINAFVGVSSQVDITTTAATLPAWWQHGTAFCRSTTGMSVTFDFATNGPFNCAEIVSGQAAGGFAYDIGFGAPNRARLRVQYAIPIDQASALDENTEYYSYKVNLLRAKTTGSGNCAGCSTPACIVLNSIQLFQPPDQANDPELDNPINSNYVTWQGASVPGCPLSTPTHSSTWGQVKSLYR